MFKEIYLFWMEHPKFWLPISEKEKIKVDEILYTKFYSNTFISIDDKYTYEMFATKKPKSMIGYIIFYDQLLRHFQRHILLLLRLDKHSYYHNHIYGKDMDYLHHLLISISIHIYDIL